jgi:hypothetical protein
MAVSLKHAFQSAVPDDGNPNTVGSNEWNAEHQLTLGPNALVGRGAEAGAAVEVPCTPFARTLLDDADAATARGTLGLGALATLATAGTDQIASGAVTYAKMQNVSATSRILGRRSAGAGAVEEMSLSQLLDFIGSAAHGDILFRGESAWQRLPAGALNQRLLTKATGANPAWGGGRQTIASGSLAGATTDLLNIPNSYSMLHLGVNNVSFDTASRALLIHADSDNGASFDTNTANYSIIVFSGSVAPVFSNLASLADAGVNNNVADVTFANLYFFSYQGSGVTLVISSTSSSGGGSRYQLGLWFGGASINAVRLLLNGSGNFDGGTYTLHAIL